MKTEIQQFKKNIFIGIVKFLQLSVKSQKFNFFSHAHFLFSKFVSLLGLLLVSLLLQLSHIMAYMVVPVTSTISSSLTSTTIVTTACKTWKFSQVSPDKLRLARSPKACNTWWGQPGYLQALAATGDTSHCLACTTTKGINVLENFVWDLC